jgi:hypothetical protein
MVKIVWIDSAIEDLNAVGGFLVELPEPKPKKKEILSRYKLISFEYQ